MPVQRFRITPTSRGALFKAKRWFYSTFYTKAPAEVKDGNKRAWTDLARKIIEEINKHNATDKPTRLTIEYEVGQRGEFKPISATLELMEMKLSDKIIINM
ncbi:MAG: hypothetical protein N3E47_01370 [Candidatus Bathyarchaeota archaeon]|nr:hypothetical protein [Candidatus Bathyarchaeota archaeon]